MRNAASVAALGLVGAALLGGGGSGSSRLLWIGGLALVAVAAGYAALGVRATPRGVALVAALAALVVWDGASVVWSVGPDLSWLATNRALVYLGFACLGLVVAVSPPRLAQGLALACGAVLGWALLAKAVPALYPDYGRVARLRSPVGYWNALAQVGDAALPLGLWAYARRRPAGALLAYAAAIAVVLTYSRSGIAFAIVSVALYLWLSGDASRGVVGLACALLPAGAVLGVCAALPGVVKDGQPRSARVHDGWIFALLVVAGGAVASLAAQRLRGVAAGPRIVRGAAAVGALAVVAGIAALAVHAGGPGKLVDEFAGTQHQLGYTASRFGSVNSSNRSAWWGEAWKAFTRHPLDGSGAGTFRLEHRLVRTSFSQPVEEPHSLPLQFLAETGIVGLLLLLAIAAAGVWAARQALRRPQRPAVAALVAGCAAYALHALVDIHWEFLAVGAPVFFVLGSLAGEPGPARPRRLALAPVAVVLVAAAGIYSLASPYLATRKLDEAAAAIDQLQRARAYSDAKSARSLNPLSIDPFLWEGATAPTLAAREAAFVKAVELQPENPDAWVALGEFELELRRWQRAYQALNRAYTLDRWNATAVRGGELDRARCRIDPATCRGSGLPAPRAGRSS